jgi:AcrR family transcriptional regulator
MIPAMTDAKRRLPKMRQETLRKREDILKAALATFGSKGYKNGPLTEIAEQVDITHAGILHHFGSKDQLLLEMLTYRDASDVAELEGQHIPDGADLFRHLIKTAMINTQRQGVVQAYVVLSSESVTDDHPARAFFENRYKVLRSEVHHAFEVMCAEHGVTDRSTVNAASASILAAMDGLQIQWLLDPNAVDLAAASEFAIRSIVSAVLSPQPSVL